jgi:hypothetical protein
MSIVQRRVRACLVAVSCALPAAAAPALPDVANPTGLPMYPNLASARLEDRLKTDWVGHWCMHLAATTTDSLDAVETWYRRRMRAASETDVRHDGNYGDSQSLDGIKLSVSIDSVAVYRTARGAPTSIDLIRCTPVI